MKINIIKKLGLALLVLTFTFSCTDVLDVKPISFITNASFWHSEDDVKGALNGMYFQLRAVAQHDLYILGEGRAEVIGRGPIGTGGYDLYYENTLRADNLIITWQKFYTVINTANLILKYAPEISMGSESAKNSYLAQAYAMRAFVYFALTKTWGELVIHTEPVESANAEVIQIARSSQADVFTQIKADLDEALKLFADNSFPTGRSYWSKPAVNALKGDVYLWTGKRLNGGTADFTTALNALNEVKSADVNLLPEFADIFKYANKGNKEFIMSVKFQSPEVGDNYFNIMWINASTIPSNADPATLAIINPAAGQCITPPTEIYRSQYTDDDTRKAGSFLEVYDYPDGVKTYYVSLVLKGQGLVESGTRKFICDVILYRYADVLLMAAEAKNALGQDPSAEINLVRQRAYKAEYASHVFANGTKAANDDAILNERLLELAFEGKRWWDLVRFDKAFDLVPSLQSKKGQNDLLLWPIPNSVLSLEPKVIQNPGWE